MGSLKFARQLQRDTVELLQEFHFKTGESGVTFPGLINDELYKGKTIVYILVESQPTEEVVSYAGYSCNLGPALKRAYDTFRYTYAIYVEIIDRNDYYSSPKSQTRMAKMLCAGVLQPRLQEKLCAVQDRYPEAIGRQASSEELLRYWTPVCGSIEERNLQQPS